MSEPEPKPRDSEIERIEALNIDPATGRPATRDKCRHIGWEWKRHGRCCFNCSTFVVDFGD
jgi:hypothetical protein